MSVDLLYCVVLCDANKTLSVLNLIRDSVVEILFEQDNEEKSVATLILDSLMQVFLFCKWFLFMTTVLYKEFLKICIFNFSHWLHFLSFM